MKTIYKIPAGASLQFIRQPNKYLAVCAHPDRKPWLIDHDGNEIEITFDESGSYPVSFADLHGLLP